MHKIRFYHSVIALLAALSGPTLQGIALGAIANVASEHHTDVPGTRLAVEKSTRLHSPKPGPCPGGGTDDC